MPRPLSRLILIMALALVALLGLLSSRASGAPLHTGFLEEQHELDGPHTGTNMNHAKSAGATTVRYLVYWNQIATAQPSNARNPDDPAYDWTDVDNMVISAHARGLQPILDLVLAPSWAERSISGASYTGTPRAGTKNPDPAKFGDFAFAAAKRYDGSPLPRVKYWQAWNETNYPYWLLPQYNTSRKMVSAGIYRNLVNRMAANVHAVHSTNFVIAGGTAPWGHKESPAPLKFARAVLCISQSKPYHSVCKKKIHFDAWSTHPYTKGGPTHKARNAGDVEIGNLPNLRKVLNAATRLHKVLNAKNVAKKRVDLWVTEFSWDSKAPDPKAVPSKLHQRWTSESLYRMWKAGVRMVVWFTIRDRPLPQSFWQSGFWYCGHATPADDPNTPLCGLDPANDVRKPSFRAFRFPFVAFAKNGKVSVWGMVPRGAPHKVAIQRSKKRGGGYKTVKSFKAGSDGIFKWRQSTSWTAGFYRAKISGEASVPFSLRRPKAYALKQPFGCGGGVSCN